MIRTRCPHARTPMPTIPLRLLSVSVLLGRLDQVPIEGIAELRALGWSAVGSGVPQPQTDLQRYHSKQKRLDALKQQFKLELRTEGYARGGAWLLHRVITL